MNDEQARSGTLLAVRKHLDDWGRKVLGDTGYERTVWSDILVFRARREIMHSRLEDGRAPARFLLTVGAEDALLTSWTRTATWFPNDGPAFSLHGVPFDVGPQVEHYYPPGKAWVMRHVSQGYLQAAGDGHIRGMFDNLVDDWCRRAGLRRVSPVELEWRKVTAVEHTLGVVYEVTARADTAPLTDPFLG